MPGAAQDTQCPFPEAADKAQTCFPPFDQPRKKKEGSPPASPPVPAPPVNVPPTVIVCCCACCDVCVSTDIEVRGPHGGRDSRLGSGSQAHLDLRAESGCGRECGSVGQTQSHWFEITSSACSSTVGRAPQSSPLPPPELSKC